MSATIAKLYLVSQLTHLQPYYLARGHYITIKPFLWSRQTHLPRTGRSFTPLLEAYEMWNYAFFGISIGCHCCTTKLQLQMKQWKAFNSAVSIIIELTTQPLWYHSRICASVGIKSHISGHYRRQKRVSICTDEKMSNSDSYSGGKRKIEPIVQLCNLPENLISINLFSWFWLRIKILIALNIVIRTLRYFSEIFILFIKIFLKIRHWKVLETIHSSYPYVKCLSKVKLCISSYKL